MQRALNVFCYVRCGIQCVQSNFVRFQQPTCRHIRTVVKPLAFCTTTTTLKMSKQQATLGSLWKKAPAASATPTKALDTHTAAEDDADGPVVKRKRVETEASKSVYEETASSKSNGAAANSTVPKAATSSAPTATALHSATTAIEEKPHVPSASVVPTGNPSDITLAYMTAISYHPVKSAPFGADRKADAPLEVPFAALAGLFAAIETTTKRIAITTALTNFLRSLIVTSPADLLPTLYLCTNTIAPAYASLELGVGDSLLIKALSEATGRNAKDIKSEFDTKGDLGLVAETSRSKQKTLFGATAKPASVRAVFAAFKSIAQESGKSSMDKKIGTIKKLLVNASGVEAKYLIRALQGKLRIGLAKQTVLVALAQAFAQTTPPTRAVESASGDSATVDVAATDAAATSLPADVREVIQTCPPIPKSLAIQIQPGHEVVEDTQLGVPIILDTRRGRTDVEMEALQADAVTVLKQVFSELPSYDAIVPALLRGGVLEARRVCALMPGVPVTPMLAKPTKGVREVLQRFENVAFTCEWKYDGERAQVHKVPDGTVSIFSRNSENSTSKFPDLLTVIQEAILGSEVPVTSCVLDGEAVAYDREKNQLMPFQVLSTRARKDVTVEDIKVQVIYVAFDLLYLNGVSLLHTPLKTRRAIMQRFFKTIPGKFGFAESAESNDVDQIATFLNDAVKGGCEGLMVKVLDGPDSVYEPSKRSLNWLKLKKDYMDGLTDSLDLVPIGAWLGKGKRTGVYGAYLLACYDPDDETYQSVTRIGTGFSDDMLLELTNSFKEKACIAGTKPSNVLVSDSLADCDVWFDPDNSEVWEVMAADLSISPVHMAAVGKVDPAKGIALRFPRFLRRRDDKSPADATSADQVADMYRGQSSTINNLKDDSEDDF